MERIKSVAELVVDLASAWWTVAKITAFVAFLFSPIFALYALCLWLIWLFAR